MLLSLKKFEFLPILKRLSVQLRHIHKSSPKPEFPEPFSKLKGREPQLTTAEKAVQVIKSGDNVFLHGAAATPNHIIEKMAQRGISERLREINLYHIHTHGVLPVSDEYRGIFRDVSMFMGQNVREAVSCGNADLVPIFLSEIPRLFIDNTIKLDVAIIQVSPPDKHGYCSLGTSVDCTRAAVKNAKMIIAQVNSFMPRTLGDGQVHISHIDYIVEKNIKLFGWDDPPKQPNDVQIKIGETIAGLVPDEATIQLGIGAIPNAVCDALKGHRNLGVHSEMFMDGVVDLIDSGVITNAFKKVHRGKTVGSFVVGSKKLYKFLHDNPSVGMLSCGYVNSHKTIRIMDKMCAINSAVEIDLTGQVVAESIGHKMISGVGGQVDFMRGAASSYGGKPILALPSQTSKGQSRIVSQIQPGAIVTTSRPHVHYVVTEFGHVNLKGKTMRERAKLLISIAHPNHRERLEREAFSIFSQ